VNTGRLGRGLPRVILLATAFALAACTQAGPPPTIPSTAGFGPGFEVRYVANEGFLIEAAGKRVLVDGLVAETVTGYVALPEQLRSPIEEGTGVWGEVDFALASHHHPDHFDPASTWRFLEANPGVVFISTPQAVERLRQTAPDGADLDGRIRAVLPPEGEIERIELDGVEILALSLHHGRRQPPVENLGFVVTLGEMRFLHFGDTEAKMESFEPYLGVLRGTELALLPFWFLASEWRAEMVRDLIRPRWIVVGHLPTPDAPAGYFARWRSHENLVEVIRTAFPDARLPSRPGDTYRFGDGHAATCLPHE
jgi:L-ascorbate metabolism protein UlaG (beta-lactamase superfamily)